MSSSTTQNGATAGHLNQTTAASAAETLTATKSTGTIINTDAPVVVPAPVAADTAAAGGFLPEPNPVSDFFARPVLVSTYSWTDSSVDTTFDALELILANPAVVSHLAHFKYLEFKSLGMSFTVSGSPYHYGELLIGNYPSTAICSTSSDYTHVRLSQTPASCYLSACGNSTTNLEIPFLSVTGLVQLANQGTKFAMRGFRWTTMVKVTAALKHASLATPPTLTVRCWAWLNGASLMVPTIYPVVAPSAKGAIAMRVKSRPRAGASQKEARKDGAVSSVATAVGRAAGDLAGVPIIGPFAAAVEVGANVVGAIASFFGFSKPVNLQAQVVSVPRSLVGMSYGEGIETSEKLSYDPKQSKTIDPRVAGLARGELLSIQSIVGRQSFLGNYSWVSTTAPTNAVFWIPVIPTTSQVTTGALSPGSHLFMSPTALAYGTFPFRAWTGTLEYTVRVVCSESHRGRLRFVYVPGKTITAAPSTEPSNIADVVMMDITESTEATISIGWTASTPWLGVTTHTMTSELLTSISTADGYYNGFIRCDVLDSLQGLLATTTCIVEVFVKAGSDYQVAMPDNSLIQRTSFNPSGVVVNIASLASAYLTHWDSAFLPTASGKGAIALRTPMESGDHAALINFGEAVVSYRPLLLKSEPWLRIKTIADISAFGAPGVAHYSYGFYLPTVPLDMFALYNGGAGGGLGGVTKSPVVSMQCAQLLYTYLKASHYIVRGGHRYKVACTSIENRVAGTAAASNNVSDRPLRMTAMTQATRIKMLTGYQAFVSADSNTVLEQTKWLTTPGNGNAEAETRSGVLDVEVSDSDVWAFRPGQLDYPVTQGVLDAGVDAIGQCVLVTATVANADTATPTGGATSGRPALFDVWHSVADDSVMEYFLGAPIILFSATQLTTDGNWRARFDVNLLNLWTV